MKQRSFSPTVFICILSIICIVIGIRVLNFDPLSSESKACDADMSCTSPMNGNIVSVNIVLKDATLSDLQCIAFDSTESRGLTTLRQNKVAFEGLRGTINMVPDSQMTISCSSDEPMSFHWSKTMQIPQREYMQVFDSVSYFNF